MSAYEFICSAGLGQLCMQQAMESFNRGKDFYVDDDSRRIIETIEEGFRALQELRNQPCDEAGSDLA